MTEIKTKRLALLVVGPAVGSAVTDFAARQESVLFDQVLIDRSIAMIPKTSVSPELLKMMKATSRTGLVEEMLVNDSLDVRLSMRNQNLLLGRGNKILDDQIIRFCLAAGSMLAHARELSGGAVCVSSDLFRLGTWQILPAGSKEDRLPVVVLQRSAAHVESIMSSILDDFKAEAYDSWIYDHTPFLAKNYKHVLWINGDESLADLFDLDASGFIPKEEMLDRFESTESLLEIYLNFEKEKELAQHSQKMAELNTTSMLKNTPEQGGGPSNES